MHKHRLAVCIGDEIYQNRFVKCLMNHYPNQFEVHVFTKILEIQVLEAQEYEVIIIGDCAKEELEILGKRGDRFLYLREEGYEESGTENMAFVDKYQEVYKIVDSIEKMIGNSVQTIAQKKEKASGQIIGIFSFTQEKLQLPFAAALCSICKEKVPVVLLDLQAFSGLELIVENIENGQWDEVLGMEDLMTVATTGEYTKGRLLAGIGRDVNFDYVHSVKNPECLAEGNVQIYRNMINILIRELGYHSVVINFGSIFSGMLELMEDCNDFYLLTSKGDNAIWREKVFREVLKKRGNENFLHRITRFEIPAVYSTDESWQQLAENWRWNGIGNQLRKQMWVTEESE